jgi:Fe-S-cluster containining protein
MTDYRPRLRGHLVDRDALRTTLRHAGLEPEALGAVLPLLDGSRTLDEILAAAGAEPGEAAVRALIGINAVEGAGDAIVERIRQIGSGEVRLPTSILEGARFECQGSGECCQNYVFGPLLPDDVARLDALDLAAAFPHVEPPYVLEKDGAKFLRTVDNRCIFLDPEGRCGLHMRFGGESKPRICQLYPITALPTIDGLRIHDKGSCATFAVSARAGLPIVDDLARLRRLFPTHMQLHHPIVNLRGVACDFAWFLRFTTMATTLIKRRLGTAPTTLQALGRALAALTAALAACPLEPGQPDEIVTRTFAGDAAHWYGAPAPAAEHAGAAAIADVVAALLAEVNRGVNAARTAAQPSAERLLVEIAPILEVLGQTSAALSSVGDAPIGAVAAVEVRDPEVDDVLRLSMRQQLFGERSIVEQRAAAGLMRIALIQLIAVYGARRRAAGDGRDQIWPEDLSRGHMLAARVLDHKISEGILLRLEPSWSAVLDGLPLVVRLGYAGAVP